MAKLEFTIDAGKLFKTLDDIQNKSRNMRKPMEKIGNQLLKETGRPIPTESHGIHCRTEPSPGGGRVGRKGSVIRYSLTSEH